MAKVFRQICERTRLGLSLCQRMATRPLSLATSLSRPTGECYEFVEEARWDFPFLRGEQGRRMPSAAEAALHFHDRCSTAEAVPISKTRFQSFFSAPAFFFSTGLNRANGYVGGFRFCSAAESIAQRRCARNTARRSRQVSARLIPGAWSFWRWIWSIAAAPRRRPMSATGRHPSHGWLEWRCTARSIRRLRECLPEPLDGLIDVAHGAEEIGISDGGLSDGFEGGETGCGHAEAYRVRVGELARCGKECVSPGWRAYAPGTGRP